jgi:hypothetical protein
MRSESHLAPVDPGVAGQGVVTRGSVDVLDVGEDVVGVAVFRPAVVRGAVEGHLDGLRRGSQYLEDGIAAIPPVDDVGGAAALQVVVAGAAEEQVALAAAPHLVAARPGVDRGGMSTVALMWSSRSPVSASRLATDACGQVTASPSCAQPGPATQGPRSSVTIQSDSMGLT